MKLLGIKRQSKFSPNHIWNDTKIFNLTVQNLEKIGYDVKVCDEVEFNLNEIDAPVIFNMGRNLQTVKRLQQLEKDGVVIVNSAKGINNCVRNKMTELLIENNIPHPRSIIVNTDSEFDGEELLNGIQAPAYWVKRGDFHSIHKEDVTYVTNASDIKYILKEFAWREILQAVINEHLEGNLVKFYGVADTDFFYSFYPFDVKHSKFGYEEKNGNDERYPFSKDHLKEVCARAATIMGVKVYGGDCIIAKDGSFKIIDFNDWPSFAPCRDVAAFHIAECIHLQYENNLKKK